MSEDDGVEMAWQKVASTITCTAKEIIGFASVKRKPWLTDSTFQIVNLKAKARLDGNKPE